MDARGTARDTAQGDAPVATPDVAPDVASDVTPDVALNVAATAGALVRYRKWAWRRNVTALVLVVMGAAAGVPSIIFDLAWLGVIAALFTWFGAQTLGIGLGALWRARPMRRLLAARPWTVCAAVSTPRPLHATTVVLKDPVTGELWTLGPLTAMGRYQLIDPRRSGSGGVLWWCGDPGKGGALAPDGGGELIWARAVRGPLRRRRAIRDAGRRGLSDRPSPGNGA